MSTDEKKMAQEKTALQGPDAAANAHHPTAWYAEMTRREKNTFWACFGGWMMDAMDVQMLTFATTGIIAAFAAARISNADVAFIGTVTLVTSSIGGWFAGALSDRFGRVRMLQVTIAWFAVFTFLCGFARTYDELLVLRALMGFGFGGEWAAAAVLVGEVIAPAHRGKAVGAMQSGWAVGWAIAAGVATLLLSQFPEEFAWRVMFWVGLAPAVLVIVLRWFVDEPPVFTHARENQKATGESAHFLAIFKLDMLPKTILACVLSIGAQGGYYAITFWLPKFLREERHLTVLRSGGYLAVIIMGSFIGYLVSAWLNDRIGRRPNFILFAVCSFAVVIVYTLIPVDNTIMLALGFPLGFLASGIFSGMGPILTELYPTRSRGSGQGFAYNFGRAVAALNLWFVGLFSDVLHMKLGVSIGIFALAAYGLVAIAALLLPETRNWKLDDPAVTAGDGSASARKPSTAAKDLSSALLMTRPADAAVMQVMDGGELDDGLMNQQAARPSKGLDADACRPRIRTGRERPFPAQKADVLRLDVVKPQLRLRCVPAIKRSRPALPPAQPKCCTAALDRPLTIVFGAPELRNKRTTFEIFQAIPVVSLDVWCKMAITRPLCVANTDKAVTNVGKQTLYIEKPQYCPANGRE